MDLVEITAGDGSSSMSDPTLAGGGEMGALMRAKDWSTTPLGPVEDWPQSLKTCVRIMLTSRQPMWLGWGDDLTYLYNDPYRSIAGGKHPEALGLPTRDVWHEIWDDVGPRIQSAMINEEGTYDEALLLIMERNGYPEETYYTFSYSPIPDDEGKICGIFCANTEDTRSIITERQVGLLRELAATTVDARSVDEACALSARCLESNPHDLPFSLIYLLDPDTRRANLAGTTRLERGHLAAPETIALDGPSDFPMAEAIRAKELRLVEGLSALFDSLPTGAWDRPPTQVVALPIAPSGDTGQAGTFIAGLNPYRIFDDDYRGFLELVAGQIAAAIANAQAYTDERRRAEALAELDRAKTAFFSNVSHEFRTPLTLMIGPLEELLGGSRGELIPAQLGELEVVHRNGLRLLRLVNTLLDFSRIEAGRQRASYERVTLPQLTADVASAFRSAIDRAGLRLVVETPPLPEEMTTYVDREMWEKIVLNLLSNAFKFTFEGEIAVSVFPNPDGRSVDLTVRDTGAGIPASELPRVFERFHRVQGAHARTHEGTGIGLALVQELVRLHGGTVQVESELGRGTAFTVTIPTGARHLPAEHVRADADPVPTGHNASAFVEEALRWLPGNTEPPLGVEPGDLGTGLTQSRAGVEPDGARVLIVDDNADMREYVARLLAGRYEVEAVADGEAALAAVRDRRPDLVLSDVMMPRLDGFGLLRALREDPRTSDIPVVLLSARTGDEATVAGLAAGADDYVVKPFTASALLARVSTQLQLARLRAEAAARERAALAEAELERSRLRELFEQAPAAIAVLRGPEHVFQLANKHYAQIFGPQRTYVGLPLRSVYPEVDRADIWALLDHVYSTAEPYVGSELYVEFDRHGDGTLEGGYFTFVLQPLHDSDEQVEGIFIHAVEVTDQVRARQEIEGAVRARDEFLSIAAHELRTPVTGIKGVAQLLQRSMARGTLDSTRHERSLDAIVSQADRLSALVVDLLDVSRLRSGQLALRPQEIDLAALVGEAVIRARDGLENDRFTIMLRGASEPCPMLGDPDRLEQILTNLLDNAVKYSPNGGEITVAVSGGDVRVSISVQDEGIGLAPGMTERIFEPFGRAPNAADHNIPGEGLGLYISRQIAERHGGSLWAESDGGERGTTFHLDLPRWGDREIATT